MNNNIPVWALRSATPEDHDVAQAAHQRGSMLITWPRHNILRTWAKQQGWPTPWFRFEEVFLAHMLANNANFVLALQHSGIEIQFPRQIYVITTAKVAALDRLYESRSAGYPNNWGTLVEELREIRRAVEAGVTVQIEGESALQDWQSFYAWAHGRYHMLEDGADKWIGDDA